MQSKNLSLRRMNQYAAPSGEPLYLHSSMVPGAARTVEQAATIIGRKAIKSFLEDTLHQPAANTDALLRRLDEERSVEISNLALLDEDAVALGLK
jgi:hypothetical protein